MNPGEQICKGVDAGMVEAQRQVLESTQLDAMKHWESTRESFVALVQRLRDEVVGTRPPKYLGESAIWGDSTVSLAVDDEDPLLRRAALSWALAEVLVDPADATLAKKAIRCMKQHGSNYERSHGAEHAVAFEALLQVVPNASKVRRCV